MWLVYSFKIMSGGFVKFMFGIEFCVILWEYINVKDVRFIVVIKEKCFFIDVINWG